LVVQTFVRTSLLEYAIALARSVAESPEDGEKQDPKNAKASDTKASGKEVSEDPLSMAALVVVEAWSLQPHSVDWNQEDVFLMAVETGVVGFYHRVAAEVSFVPTFSFAPVLSPSLPP
jgi:hypothetical protein